MLAGLRHRSPPTTQLLPLTDSPSPPPPPLSPERLAPPPLASTTVTTDHLLSALALTINLQKRV
ncbi:MAG: hypothetical protein HC840_03280 [Leptolyngbyaceae cyanobacterium RM2_2_4]|nr:hypothetical protein [Leptolyngbyaceae cyanobacterium SM1_4_3]NJN91912.1 hypothetical protein [Leptolyngbyaceae cyanobacterium SL_5_14]NJO48657.1 hypothetical protein [Leptolyngbyaceae cyanobacterium RM2_2_4]NJO76821.1 hypothetical protein [Leptolyngbyaceae cyanobacterium RM1_406_9]